MRTSPTHEAMKNILALKSDNSSANEARSFFQEPLESLWNFALNDLLPREFRYRKCRDIRNISRGAQKKFRVYPTIAVRL